MNTPDCYDGCRRFILDIYAVNGIEANASHLPPLMPTEYEPPLGMTCPHGVSWYAEPTSDQIATWVREGVR